MVVASLRAASPRLLLLLAGCVVAGGLSACPSGAGDRGTGSLDTLARGHVFDSTRDTAPKDQPIVAADTATIARLTDTTVTNAKPGTTRLETLGSLADSISDGMTFLALTQTTFVAATRGKRLLLDLGRYDGAISGGRQRRAFEQAATALSPVHVGDRFALHGSWGADSATVTAFALWNGRIVATLALPARVDALGKSGVTLVALATRAPPLLNPDSTSRTPDTSAVKAESIARPARDSAMHAPDTAVRSADTAAKPDSASLGCNRDSVDEQTMLRVAGLADSLAAVLAADTATLTDRLKKTVKTQHSHAVGCFGPWRVMLFVNQSAGDYEYVHEIALLVDSTGVATPLTVRDLRFKAHEAIRAFDADGDGIDDVAVRGRGNRIGGTVILRFVPRTKRLEYVMGGFAWEEI